MSTDPPWVCNDDYILKLWRLRLINITSIGLEFPDNAVLQVHVFCCHYSGVLTVCLWWPSPPVLFITKLLHLSPCRFLLYPWRLICKVALSSNLVSFSQYIVELSTGTILLCWSCQLKHVECYLQNSITVDKWEWQFNSADLIIRKTKTLILIYCCHAADASTLERCVIANTKLLRDEAQSVRAQASLSFASLAERIHNEASQHIQPDGTASDCSRQSLVDTMMEGQHYNTAIRLFWHLHIKHLLTLDIENWPLAFQGTRWPSQVSGSLNIHFQKYVFHPVWMHNHNKSSFSIAWQLQPREVLWLARLQYFTMITMHVTEWLLHVMIGRHTTIAIQASCNLEDICSLLMKSPVCD